MSGLRILVLGYVVRAPLGGLAWHYLNYVAALARLGHQVTFLEDTRFIDDDEPWGTCYDPREDRTGDDPSAGIAFLTTSFAQLCLPERWAFYDARTSSWVGPVASELPELVREADLLINISRINPLRGALAEVPVRVLIDTDPAFTQVRHLCNPRLMQLAAMHNRFFTFGESIGRTGCVIPDDGLRWMPTRQPLCLEHWPSTPPRRDGRLTTVMQWKSYQTETYAGVFYGNKQESFPPYAELPGRVGRRLELALGSPSAPRRKLRALGWHVRNPLPPSRDLWTYQRYIQRSMGEFALAKHGYVVAHSGWFSERSAAYLASGRPVIAQDTGYGLHLPTGRGLLPFSTLDEAVEAIAMLDADYERHCRAAREIAQACFAPGPILSSLIERAFRTSHA